MAEHPTKDTLELYMLDRLPPDETANVTAHLIECEGCQRVAISEGDLAIEILSSASGSDHSDQKPRDIEDQSDQTVH